MKRFDYPLEPVLQRTQATLDAARLKLAQCDKSIAESREQLAALAAHLESAARGGSGGLDPARAQQTIAYLTQTRERIAERQRALEGLEKLREGARGDCIEANQKLEAFAAHRAAASAEFIHVETARTIRETDRDWLARAALKKAGQGR